jgi:glucose-6-phosphate isomerase
MGNIKLDYSKTLSFIREDDIFAFQAEIEQHIKSLYNKTGKGNDFLGWVNLPSSISFDDIKKIENTASFFKKSCDIVIIIGIGGSYLGAKAVVDALNDNFIQLKERNNPLVVFAGQNLSEDYLSELRFILNNKNWGIVVISKSGTTTEPAIAFRILKSDIEKKYGKQEAAKRIVTVTDAKKGALRTLANNERYKTFEIPDNVGGRFSVLTPVGLLPIAIAGFDIAKLVKGANDMQKMTAAGVPFEDNPSAVYAAVRNALLRKGKGIEIMANYNPKLHYFAEWWKQLYGESEGKDSKGIFPASVDFTSDLHSMGQYIQEGVRNLFETVISVTSPNTGIVIEKDSENLDGLNYLAGKRIDNVNKMAELGTTLAHVDGGVPNIKIEIPEISEYYLGQLIYFYEFACGISGYILGVNPFDQPGVEAYKKNMFALLEKPGYEKETNKIKEKL